MKPCIIITLDINRKDLISALFDNENKALDSLHFAPGVMTYRRSEDKDLVYLISPAADSYAKNRNRKNEKEKSE